MSWRDDWKRDAYEALLDWMPTIMVVAMVAATLVGAAAAILAS